jgi:mono/diheme cytochrome c family protein
MWNIEKRGSRQPEARNQQVLGGSSMWRPGWRVCAFLLAAGCWLLAAGCRMDMQDQPRYIAYRASTTFSDGASARPLVEGTIPRGWLRADELYYTGKMSGTQARTPAGASGGATLNVAQTGTPNIQGGTGGQVPGTNAVNAGGNVGGNVGQRQGGTSGASNPGSAGNQAGAPQDANMFPFPITADVLARGQERYNIYCSVCHGMTGYGDGMIVRRGFRRPPSYHTEQLRQAPVGHFFDVITNGWGAMPDYASQIPVQDRWAIIAYVRALQLSQQVNKSEVPPEKLQQTQGGGQTEGGGERH